MSHPVINRKRAVEVLRLWAKQEVEDAQNLQSDPDHLKSVKADARTIRSLAKLIQQNKLKAARKKVRQMDSFVRDGIPELVFFLLDKEEDMPLPPSAKLSNVYGLIDNPKILDGEGRAKEIEGTFHVRLVGNPKKVLSPNGYMGNGELVNKRDVGRVLQVAVGAVAPHRVYFGARRFRPLPRWQDDEVSRKTFDMISEVLPFLHKNGTKEAKIVLEKIRKFLKENGYPLPKC